MMISNLDALQTELYNAISNWNDSTQNEDGEKILTEREVGAQAHMAFDTVSDNLQELGLI